MKYYKSIRPDQTVRYLKTIKENEYLIYNKTDYSWLHYIPENDKIAITKKHLDRYFIEISKEELLLELL